MTSNPTDRETGISGSKLDAVLLVSATTAMAIAIAVLIYVMVAQLNLYHTSIETELQRTSNVDHLAVLAYGRSADYAASKYSALLLGFALIFLGSGYVLRMSTVAYSLSAEGGGTTASLATSSPGLVMASLGVGLVALAVLTQSDVSLTYSSQPPLSLPIVEDASD